MQLFSSLGKPRITETFTHMSMHSYNILTPTSPGLVRSKDLQRGMVFAFYHFRKHCAQTTKKSCRVLMAISTKRTKAESSAGCFVCAVHFKQT